MIALARCIQARDYCKKRDETYLEGPWAYGDEPQQGKRMDLDAAKADIEAGMGEADLAEKHFAAWVRYRQSFNQYRLLRQPGRTWVTQCTVYWGSSGTGKSRRAAWEAGPDHYVLPNSGGPTVWWDGYTGQPHVIIDEFYGWIKYHDMLRILDRYPLHVQVMFLARLSLRRMRTMTTCMQVKGGHVQLLATHIWITSNDPPYMWYKKGLQSLQRRLAEPLGRIVEMQEGVWAPPDACLAPLPPSLVVSAETARAMTPTLTTLGCGSSTR